MKTSSVVTSIRTNPRHLALCSLSPGSWRELCTEPSFYTSASSPRGNKIGHVQGLGRVIGLEGQGQDASGKGNPERKLNRRKILLGVKPARLKIRIPLSQEVSDLNF